MRSSLETRLSKAFGVPVDCQLCKNPAFGDYQTSVAMRLSKSLASNPKDLAQSLIDQAIEKNSDSLHGLELSVLGPGFINIRLTDDALIQALDQPRPTLKERVVIDYSSPNVAKAMHVGHLRSTIIGDTLASAMEYLGMEVIRLNHIGDWGTSFGMLLHYIQQADIDPHQSLNAWVEIYQQAKRCFDEDPSFQEASRQTVVKLQAQDPELINLWKILCHTSQMAYESIYQQLSISQELKVRGESFYQPYLKPLVERLKKEKIATVSEGATCVFLPGYETREGTPLPLIIQKSDGGFNYATTDLAALSYRIEHDLADRLVYVTDMGQSLHFEMIFKTAKLAKLCDQQTLTHIPFGLVLGEDGKKFKTRSGDTVPLQALLDESVHRAYQIMKKHRPTWDEPSLQQASNVLGIGAIKYADLSCLRTQDYQFSFDKMLAFEGNTVVFLLYARCRIRSLLRKTTLAPTRPKTLLPTERALLLACLQFDDVVLEVVHHGLPNRLTEYLYQLCHRFNAFFRDCPVLGDPLESQRIFLCQYTQTVLDQGFKILGIQTLERL